MCTTNPHAKLVVKSGNFYNTTIVSEVKNNQNKMIIGKIINKSGSYGSYLKKFMIGSTIVVASLASIYYLYL
jgi:hypothetical protein